MEEEHKESGNSDDSHKEQEQKLNKDNKSGYSDQSYSELEEERDMRIYCAQARASEGFDVDDYPRLKEVMYGLIIPLSNPNGLETVRESTEFALAEYNKKNQTKYQLVEILKTNCAVSGGMEYYITLQAVDDKGDTKIFQTEVFYGIPDEDGNPDIEVIIFRVKADTQLKVDASS